MDLKVVEGELELVNLGPVIVQIFTQLGQGRLQWLPASGAMSFMRKNPKKQQEDRNFFSRGAVPFSLRVLMLKCTEKPVLRIRIRMFLGLPYPDQLVQGTDTALDMAPDPSIIKQNK